MKGEGRKLAGQTQAVCVRVFVRDERSCCVVDRKLEDIHKGVC